MHSKNDKYSAYFLVFDREWMVFTVIMVRHQNFRNCYSKSLPVYNFSTLLFLFTSWIPQSSNHIDALLFQSQLTFHYSLSMLVNLTRHSLSTLSYYWFSCSSTDWTTVSSGLWITLWRQNMHLYINILFSCRLFPAVLVALGQQTFSQLHNLLL